MVGRVLGDGATLAHVALERNFLVFFPSSFLLDLNHASTYLCIFVYLCPL